jgi:hypothetical protein
MELTPKKVIEQRKKSVELVKIDLGKLASIPDAEQQQIESAVSQKKNKKSLTISLDVNIDDPMSCNRNRQRRQTVTTMTQLTPNMASYTSSIDFQDKTKSLPITPTTPSIVITEHFHNAGNVYYSIWFNFTAV